MMPLTILWDCEMYHVLTSFPVFWMILMMPLIVYFTVGRFFTDAWHRSRLAYVLTDRRALMITQGIFETAKSVSLNSPAQIVLRQDGGDAGTVSFGPRGFSPWGGGTLGPRPPSPAFEAIADAPEVYRMVLTAQRSH